MLCVHTNWKIIIIKLGLLILGLFVIIMLFFLNFRVTFQAVLNHQYQGRGHN